MYMSNYAIIQCNSPTFVGNGSVCGLDSDGDKYPDVKLDCDGPRCEAVHML